MAPRADGPRLVRAFDPERDHFRGARHAAIALVEYGDFECPHCRAARAVVEEALRELDGEVVFAYRHFPLGRVHPYAQAAAEAAEAAGAQGRFWEMHDLLFESQDVLDERLFVSLARSLGLDVDRFVDELRSGAHSARVLDDFGDGVRSGVNGTPTFFVDGRRFDGAWEDGGLLETLRERVEALDNARREAR